MFGPKLNQLFVIAIFNSISTSILIEILAEIYIDLTVVDLDLSNLVPVRHLHLHCESNRAALVLPIRVNFYGTMVGLHKTLADEQTHATPLLIHICSAL